MEQTINLSNGRLHISDPCYLPTIHNSLDVLPGVYRCYVAPGRVAMYICHELTDMETVVRHGWEVLDFTVGVDSGLMGFFDFDYARTIETDVWYNKKILGDDNIGEIPGTIIDKLAFISRTAYGDGTYDVRVHRNHIEKIVAAMVVFDEFPEVENE